MFVGEILEESFVSHVDDVKLEEVGEADGVFIKWLFGPEEGLDYYLRKTILKPGGTMPYHKHDYDHAEYVLKGKLKISVDGEERILEEGNFFYAPEGVPHKGENPGEDDTITLFMMPAMEGKTELID